MFVETVADEDYNNTVGFNQVEVVKINKGITKAEFDEMVDLIKHKLFPEEREKEQTNIVAIEPICKKCTSSRYYTIKRVGPHYGLYCAKCGSWVKWLNSKEAKDTIAKYKV